MIKHKIDCKDQVHIVTDLQLLAADSDTAMEPVIQTKLGETLLLVSRNWCPTLIHLPFDNIVIKNMARTLQSFY
jgi:hypothetical protein